MSDPIADLLTSLRNGYSAGKRTVAVPYSQFKESLGQILVKEGFLTKLTVQGKKPTEKKILFQLKYQAKKPALQGIKRISKPGVRLYAKAKRMPPVREGFGITIVSTPAGLMTGKEANQKKLGGEIICQVW